MGFFKGATVESPTGRKFRLNELSRKILRIIQKNARLPLSGIAKSVGVSELTVGKYLSNLEQQNIIRHYRAQIASSHMGLTVTANIDVKLASPKKFKIIDKILKLEGPVVLNEVTGDMDLHITVSLPSMNELRLFLHEQLTQLSGILDVETSIVLKHYSKFPM